MTKYAFRCLILLGLALSLNACVTKKKYLEVEQARQNTEAERDNLKKENIALTTENNELMAKLLKKETDNNQMAQDSAELGQKYRALADKYDRLNKSYEDLNKTLASNSQMSASEMQKLLSELQKNKEDLQTKEDLLKKTEADLKTQKSSLDALASKLEEKEKRLNELQSILDKKDSIVLALKNKVLAALTGFVGKGLSVEQKNGKVYVHMDEKLLFASGSFELAPAGVEALKNLAKVLESNPDINITVEGHTDNVPYKASSGQISDNWDLSVMRATAVVKILLKNSKVDASRISAAGRSQYSPVDPANTPEARAKNRRTEIILTPKLDELFKILESN
jgi:chemotaxis protein MotB